MEETRGQGKVRTISHDGKTIGWIHEEEYQNLQKYAKSLNELQYRYMIYGKPEISKARRERRLKDHSVYAYILVGKTRIMCHFNNNNGKAYKMDGYERTWMEWKHFTFLRYCTSFDL